MLHNEIHEAQICLKKTSAEPFVLFGIGIGMNPFHFITLDTHTTTAQNIWIEKERGEAHQIREAIRPLLIGGAWSIIKGQ